jgi:hypothetical protein
VIVISAAVSSSSVTSITLVTLLRSTLCSRPKRCVPCDAGECGCGDGRDDVIEHDGYEDKDGESLPLIHRATCNPTGVIRVV